MRRVARPDEVPDDDDQRSDDRRACRQHQAHLAPEFSDGAGEGVWVTIHYPTQERWTDRSGHQRQRVRAEERVILAVLGVWPDGRHAILHYTVATTEDTAAWLRVGQELRERGLDENAVQLVVSDGTKGLPTAMRRHLPKARLQRCTVHKVRGLARYLTYAEAESATSVAGSANPSPEEVRQQRRTAISTQALEIFQAPTREEAEQRLATFVATWSPLEPKAVQTFQHSIAHCFTFYQCDPSLHALVRSTNLLERFFREFRAKADEIGAFPNEDSCLMVDPLSSTVAGSVFRMAPPSADVKRLTHIASPSGVMRCRRQPPTGRGVVRVKGFSRVAAP